MKEMKYKERKNTSISSKESIYRDVLRRRVNPILKLYKIKEFQIKLFTEIAFR